MSQEQKQPQTGIRERTKDAELVRKVRSLYLPIGEGSENKVPTFLDEDMIKAAIAEMGPGNSTPFPYGIAIPTYDENDPRTFEEKMEQVDRLLMNYCEGSDPTIRRAAKSILDYFHAAGYAGEVKWGSDPEPVKINLFRMFALLDNDINEGDWAELPWGDEDGSSIHILAHLYAKCEYIDRLPEGEMNYILDSSGTYCGTLFNNEDIVIYHRGLYTREAKKMIKLSLIDIKRDPSELAAKKPAEKVALLKAHLGDVPSITYEAVRYDPAPQPLMTVHDGLYDAQGILIENELPDDCAIPMEIGEIVHSRFMDEIRKAEITVNAMADRVLRAMEDTKEPEVIPAPPGTYNIATGNDALKYGPDLLMHMNNQGRYKKFVDGILKTAEYIGGATMHGMPVPDAAKTGGAEINGVYREDAYDVRHNVESFAAFFYTVATQRLDDTDMWVMDDINFPHLIRKASRANFISAANQRKCPNGTFNRAEYGFDLCAYLIGPSVIRDGSVPPTVDPKASGGGRNAYGIFRLGVSSRCPENFRNLVAREGRGKYGPVAPAKEWDKYKFSKDEQGFKTFMEWYDGMEDLVEETGKRQRPQVTSRTQNACVLMDMNDDTSLTAKISQKLATNVMREASLTVGVQMLDLMTYCAEVAMSAAGHRGGDDTFFYAVNHSNRVATVTRTAAPVQKFTGASQIIWVSGPRKSLGENYEDLSWIGGHREFCAVSKAVFWGKRQIRHLSTAVDRVMVHLVSHHMNLAEIIPVINDPGTKSMDYGMCGHLAVCSINPTRNFSTAVSVGRWLTQIMSGLAGDPSSIVKKADVGVFMTMMDAYAVAQTLLRCGAASVLRDAGEHSLLFPRAAVDKIRTMSVVPTFATGTSKANRSYSGVVTLQQMHNNWYTCEVFSGEHGNMTAANLNAIGLVFDILEEYDNEETKKRLCGVSEYTIAVWKTYKDLPRESRKLMVGNYLAEHLSEFIAAEQKFLEDLLDDEDTKKGSCSVIAILENADRCKVPAYVWKAAFIETTRQGVASTLTTKRGLLRHDVGPMVEGRTASAAEAFLPGLVDIGDPTLENIKAALLSNKSKRSGSVLACALRAFRTRKKGTFTIVNKYNSVEKDRCIAVMDWVMRYPSLMVETMFEHVLKNGSATGEHSAPSRTVPNSVLEVKDKVKPLLGLLRDVRTQAREAGYHPDVSKPVQYPDGKSRRVIRLMNDASAWGPWKNLMSMYLSALGAGMSGEPLMLTRYAIELFMTKEMVLHNAMCPPSELPTNGMREKKKKAREMKNKRMAAKWNDSFVRFS